MEISRSRRSKRGLRHHLTLILVLKLMALVLIWSLFFRPALRVEVDDDAAARQLFDRKAADARASAAAVANQER